MKKKLLILFITILALFLAACTQGKQGDEDNQAHDHEHETENVGKDEDVLRIAFMGRKDSAHYQAVEQFAGEVEVRTEGALRVALFPGGELGSTESLLSSMAAKEDKIDIVIADVADLKQYYSAIDVCEMPFLFEDYEEARDFLDGHIQARAQEKLLSQNMRILTHYANGFHCVITKELPIESTKDIQKMVIGTSGDGQSALAMKSVGALTREMETHEVAERLRQGNCDGYEDSLQTIYAQRLYEGQKYLTVTNHSFSASFVVVADDAWSKLDKSVRDIVEEAIVSSSYSEYSEVKRQDNEMLNQIESHEVRIGYPKLNEFWNKAEFVVRGQSEGYTEILHEVIEWKNMNN